MFIFQFLNDKIYNYVLFDIIVDFIIQKLKNKHTSLKKYTNRAKLSSLVLREQEETKTRYFAPMAQASSARTQHLDFKGQNMKKYVP